MDNLCKSTIVVLIFLVLSTSSAGLSFDPEVADRFVNFEKDSESNMSEKIQEKTKNKIDKQNSSNNIEEKIEKKVEQKERELKQRRIQRVSEAGSSKETRRRFLSRILDIFANRG